MDKEQLIHINQDDDITQLMSALKKSQAETIKLVSPKGSQALTSPINLKLLKKSAESNGRQLVLVTKERNIEVLAGGLGILTAGDVKSSPSVPQLAAKAPPEQPKPTTLKVKDNTVDMASPNPAPGAAVEPAEPLASGTSATKSQQETQEALPQGDKPDTADDDKAKKPIPTIDRLRKRILIGIAALLALGGLWYYLTRIHPTAEITVYAQTQKVPIKITASASDSYVESNPSRRQLKVFKAERSEIVEQEFASTGEKDIGEPASGTVKISNCSESEAFSIPSGTGFSSGGKNYSSTSEVVVPGASFSGGECDSAGEAKVSVRSGSGGAQFNIDNGSSFVISGVNADVDATADGAFSGGSSETVKVVAQADIDQAKNKLSGKTDQAIQEELSSKFDDSFTVVNSSFTATSGETEASPKVGEEAGKGKVTVEITYSIVAIKNSDIKQLLESIALEDASDSQGVSDNGFGSLVVVEESQKSAGTLELKLSTDSYLGPKIDLEALKPQLAGSKYNSAETLLSGIDGVNDVDIDLSFFGFGTLPGEDKIDIRLDVSDYPDQENN